MYTNKESNSGDDVAGTVEKLGSNVDGFHKGERVAAFHVMFSSNGAFAEYAIAPAHTVFPIPSGTPYQEAATIPLAAYTAAVGLFDRLEFPSPWDARAVKGEYKKRPLLVYGASTAVGAFAIKLAKAANIHPIIAVGSKNSKFVKPFLDESKGDSLLDYTEWKTADDAIAAIKAVAKDVGRIWNVFDGVSEEITFNILPKAIAGPPDQLGRKPRIAIVLPFPENMKGDPSVDISQFNVGHVHGDTEGQTLFGLVWGQAFTRGLKEGWLTPHPHEEIEGLENGVESALNALKKGEVRAKKFVIRVSKDE